MAKIPLDLLRNTRKTLFFGLFILIAISSLAYQQKDLFLLVILQEDQARKNYDNSRYNI